MARIKVLPQELINQISAGEVLERPASAIRELIENSIDASSDSIIIKTKDSGKKSIEIIDNGIGMDSTDIRNAVKRHATSKISDTSDLFNITSLGFRGEALASIAAVSSLTIASREQSSDMGAELVFEYGRLIKENSVSMNLGTRIKIEDIYKNTPARLKFLKSEKTELSHIVELIKHYVFLYPFISFEYYNNDKRVFKFLKAKSRLERLKVLKKTDNWFYKEIDSNYVSGEVFLLKPSSDIRKKELKIYVNGRYVVDKLISKAILNAYQELSINKDEMLAYLVLNIEPSFVDLNVSPTKSEVRFLEPHFIFDLVYKSILSFATRQEHESKSLLSYSFHSNKFLNSRGYTAPKQPSLPRSKPIRKFTQTLYSNTVLDTQKHEYNKIGTDYQIIGQFLSKYIIVESGENLVIIDQHAAHERINYEKIKRDFNKGERQKLLVPITLNISDFNEVDLRALEKINISYKVKDDKLELTAIPSILEGLDIRAVLNKFLNTKSMEDFYKIVATTSCHASVRGNYYLPHLEQRNLIDELMKCEYPYACPHGRPTVINFTQRDIEQLFERV